MTQYPNVLNVAAISRPARQVTHGGAVGETQSAYTFGRSCCDAFSAARQKRTAKGGGCKARSREDDRQKKTVARKGHIHSIPIGAQYGNNGKTKSVAVAIGRRHIAQ